MKKIKTSILFSIIFAFLFIASCANENVPEENLAVQGQKLEEKVAEERPEEAAISWPPDTPGPWDSSLYMATSSDGLMFSEGTFVLEHAGVPNLLLTSKNQLILIYQYFSYEEKDMFDVIAYSISDDNGKTWSAPLAISFAEVPPPLLDYMVPMDPTLVETEDGALRLYFTYHAKGAQKPTLYSATAADGQITSPFVVEETPALSIDASLLDPAVVYFNGKWHHYTQQPESDDNYHSISSDGISFTLEDDISLPPLDFLGQVISVDDGLRFYGTGFYHDAEGGVLSAFSSDGYTWKMDDGTRVQGADPGVAQLADGTYVMVYISFKFN